MAIGEPFDGLIYGPKYFRHKAQLQTMGRSKYGDINTVITTSVTVSCYAYYGEVMRHSADRTQETGYRWNMLLPNTVNPHVNDIFMNIVDQNGNVVLSQGTITETFPYVHHRRGLRFIQAILKIQ